MIKTFRLQANSAIAPCLLCLLLAAQAFTQDIAILDIERVPSEASPKPVLSVAIDKSNRVLLGGRFTRVGGKPRSGFARLRPDGSLDDSFSPTLQSDEGDVEVGMVHCFLDGTLLVQGDFSKACGTAVPGLARIHSDGSLDTAFAKCVVRSFALTIESLRSVAIDSEGMVYVAGRPAKGTSQAIIRINSQGAIDKTFSTDFRDHLGDPTHTPGTPIVFDVFCGDQGSVYCDGFYRQIGELPVRPHCPVRLRVDGRLDAQFSTPKEITRIYSVAPDHSLLVEGEGHSLSLLSPDGKQESKIVTLPDHSGIEGAVVHDKVLYVYGAAINCRGVKYKGLLCLSLDGTISPGFKPIRALDSPSDEAGIAALAFCNDGKLLVGGEFTGINGVPRYRLARLNPDGSLNDSFTPAQID